MRKILFVIILSVSYGSIAADNLMFSGALIERADCVINNNKTIDVDFGSNVGVGKVDGVNYRENINYSLDCLPGGSTSGLGIVVSGVSIAYDESAITTSVTDLGIKFLINDKPLAINKRIDINASNPPKIDVVLVKRPGSLLKTGAFNASATLLAMYD
ncbi:fimbrial protein [Serratia ureilytica]|uniref:fimbrial protein n=1 Tax=Serratia ureilytica TaxID=300181 RepID=UPI0018E73119|nr:fimbrial protein [Serratia ureilytica]MBJ2099157.1 pilus assembly protein [Serratia ureilytica]